MLLCYQFCPKLLTHSYGLISRDVENMHCSSRVQVSNRDQYFSNTNCLLISCCQGNPSCAFGQWKYTMHSPHSSSKQSLCGKGYRKTNERGKSWTTQIFIEEFEAKHGKQAGKRLQRENYMKIFNIWKFAFKTYDIRLQLLFVQYVLFSTTVGWGEKRQMSQVKWFMFRTEQQRQNMERPLSVYF